MHDLNRDLSAPVPAASLLGVHGLTHRYPGGTEALRSIDLGVAAGERIALVGHNGSGKTTLVKILCGLLPPTAGTVRYRGETLGGEVLQRARLEIGLLFQDPDDQLFGHTLLDDVAFGPRNQGFDLSQAEDRAREALGRVALSQLAYKPPHHLSLGQRKRAALAGLLAMRPAVLILDEPTANLDPRNEEVFLDLLREFPGTLICISHDLLFLYELCDRAVVLDRGAVHHDYALRDLVSHRGALREHGLDFSFRFSGAVMPDPAPLPSGASARAPEPSTPPLACLQGYDFRYPDGTTALRGVDLTLRDGERVAIVGENGAGKTTLLSCLLGLREGRGAFEFAGRPVTRRSRRELWREVGMVFQDCADQLFCPSVEEEVAFGLEQLGLSREEVRDRVSAALARVRLAGFGERVPLHLSGGERKRLALASVLAMEPRLLILDEPTAGLDPEGEQRLLEILRELRCTLLLVSHDLFFVRELTERTLVMHRGEIVRDLPTSEFLRDPALATLNGLAYTYRQRSSDAIRQLQHLHEHEHWHRHLHEHEHRHDGVVHSHPHEHVHQHPHRFVHEHPQGSRRHGHPPRRLHDHEHEGHGDAPHAHDHDGE